MNRPTSILWSFWDSVIVTEEQAMFFDPIYLEMP